MNGKKILITTETRELTVIRREPGRCAESFCPKCCEYVEMLNFDAAISFSGIGGRELMMRLETGEIHSVERDSGHLQICGWSLKGRK
ncbi:MAG: hypothetical protein IPM25_11325 [Chloracidobacterium sp.]|nr:hypothetical protein [Chloracidobacterium sp.]